MVTTAKNDPPAPYPHRVCFPHHAAEMIEFERSISSILVGVSWTENEFSDGEANALSSLWEK